MQLEGHAVSANAFQNGQQYATCLFCGGLAQMGIIGPSNYGINGSLMTTINGSFILPNGVIVLVDEDIDAYMEGVLLFTNPNAYLLSNNYIVMYNPEQEKRL